MKKLLALLLAIVMVLGMAACGQKAPEEEASTPESTPAASTPESSDAPTEPAAEGAKTLYANQGPTEYFEVPWFNVGAQTYVKALFETLIGMDNKSEPTTETGMAASYEMAADSLSMTLTLRDGLKWHDGTDVTVDDVIWTVETIPNMVQPAQSLVRGGCENVKSMTADGNTITFEFKDVNATQLQCFAQLHILPKHCLENADLAQFQQDPYWQSPIGSGPFKVESAVMGEYANLIPFEEYWNGVADFNIYVTPSHMDADPNFVTKVLDGKLDYGYTKAYADVQALEGKPGVTVTPVSVLYTRYIHFNQFLKEEGKPELLADARVRQAIAYAIDREAICSQVFNGACDPGVGTVTPTGSDWKLETVEPYAYNPEKAKELLAEAGWDSNRTLTLGYYYTDQQTVDMVAIIQGMLAQVGVKIEGKLLDGDNTVTLNGQPSSRDANGVATCAWDLLYAALAATSPHNYYTVYGSTTGTDNGRPVTQEVDDIIAAMMGTTDLDTQKAEYAKLEQMAADEMWKFPMYYQPIWVVTSDKVVDNLDLDNLGNPQFHWNWDLQNWTLK